MCIRDRDHTVSEACATTRADRRPLRTVREETASRRMEVPSEVIERRRDYLGTNPFPHGRQMPRATLSRVGTHRSADSRARTVCIDPLGVSASPIAQLISDRVAPRTYRSTPRSAPGRIAESEGRLRATALTGDGSALGRSATPMPMLRRTHIDCLAGYLPRDPGYAARITRAQRALTYR